MAGHAEVVKALLWNGITQVDGVQMHLVQRLGFAQVDAQVSGLIW